MGGRSRRNRSENNLLFGGVRKKECDDDKVIVDNTYKHRKNTANKYSKIEMIVKSLYADGNLCQNFYKKKQ